MGCVGRFPAEKLSFLSRGIPIFQLLKMCRKKKTHAATKVHTPTCAEMISHHALTNIRLNISTNTIMSSGGSGEIEQTLHVFCCLKLCEILILCNFGIIDVSFPQCRHRFDLIERMENTHEAGLFTICSPNYLSAQQLLNGVVATFTRCTFDHASNVHPFQL